MKAAILYALGETPKYGDFEEPVPQNPEQLLITLKAASVKNLDKGIASGAHYKNPTVFRNVTEFRHRTTRVRFWQSARSNHAAFV